MGTHSTEVAKNLSNKYSKKLPYSAKKSSTDEIKTAPKRTIQKTAEATSYLIGNKIADKITNISKVHSKEANNEMPKQRYISPEEKHQIIDELRLI